MQNPAGCRRLQITRFGRLAFPMIVAAVEICLQRIREYRRSGHDSGIRGTPAFFSNGRIQDVSFGLQSLFDVVEGVAK